MALCSMDTPARLPTSLPPTMPFTSGRSLTWACASAFPLLAVELNKAQARPGHPAVLSARLRGHCRENRLALRYHWPAERHLRPSLGHESSRLVHLCLSTTSRCSSKYRAFVVSLFLASSVSTIYWSLRASPPKNGAQALLVHTPYSLWHAWTVVLVIVSGFAGALCPGRDLDDAAKTAHSLRS